MKVSSELMLVTLK